MTGGSKIAVLAGMTETELLKSIQELCRQGLITCTRGEPGDDEATYALSWLPLDNPELYPPEARNLHARNLRRFGGCAS